jgi:hypothetical protein
MHGLGLFSQASDFLLVDKSQIVIGAKMTALGIPSSLVLLSASGHSWNDGVGYFYNQLQISI